eukprot:CAMPEP_0117689194 /NCGR_PEP_ID=MMETSP0804-20121206/24328_1 /TAXON_ID=1074897 /ORGANISM="Tetraselmis astigmatica, Strain CCMP880" /LENGTH=221 /DNA_ID=CAMNT_0005501887 /DNA_START=217 /DNA_END=884 /DNA_ORIENTATION=-
MADTLPFSDAEATEKLRQEYLDKSRSGSAEAADACFRYAWALCHSADHRQNKEGVSLTETALAAMPDDRSQNDISAREFKYIQAVALFKMREFSRARHVCNEILEVSGLSLFPSCCRHSSPSAVGAAWEWAARRLPKALRGKSLGFDAELSIAPRVQFKQSFSDPFPALHHFQESPACRQAETLKALSEDALVKEGLIGVGVAGVAGLVIAGIVTAAFKGR